MPMTTHAKLKYRCEYKMAWKSELVLVGTLHSDQLVAYGILSGELSCELWRVLYGMREARKARWQGLL